MFERFNESAKWSLFHARAEAGNLGALAIEPEHLLLGLLHKPHGVVKDVFARAELTRDQVHTLLEERGLSAKKVKPEVEMPFSEPAKRVIEGAAAQADRLQQMAIGPQHLLMALVLEEGTVAASILSQHHVAIGDIRAVIATLPHSITEN